ncbi:hypothetical protein [Draconibacterium sediminis]|uniref:Uncharacterized protein n=1 Tax=Draconibacterium sediminis TaxID=1544798 RepID=A0A0D8J8D2_9BACT|nr:hypothetical protein [Draconibacterium sediminis]KJF42063.1 hypothetical protein LH29_22565 [Draconibacterium sediminis]
MEQHTPYEQIRKRPCDFIVKYRFLTEEEGGRKTGPPSQRYKSDFMYYGDNPMTERIFMIHPEFIDDNGNVILDKSLHSWTGKANMWILNTDFNEYHKRRIKLGLKGFFMEGAHRTAVCEVIEIVGLK